MAAPIPWKHALRDLAILGLTLVSWRVDTALRDSGGLAAWVSAIATGSLTAFVGYLFHEWGHLTAAVVAGAKYRLPDGPGEIFLFNFDVGRSTPGQFVCMSLGGFAASAVAVAFLLLVMPTGALAGKIALVLVVLGILATVVLELPPFFRVLAGGPMPRGVAFVGADDARRGAGTEKPGRH